MVLLMTRCSSFSVYVFAVVAIHLTQLPPLLLLCCPSYSSTQCQDQKPTRKSFGRNLSCLQLVLRERKRERERDCMRACVRVRACLCVCSCECFMRSCSTVILAYRPDRMTTMHHTAVQKIHQKQPNFHYISPRLDLHIEDTEPIFLHETPLHTIHHRIKFG